MPQASSSQQPAYAIDDSQLRLGRAQPSRHQLGCSIIAFRFWSVHTLFTASESRFYRTSCSYQWYLELCFHRQDGVGGDYDHVRANSSWKAPQLEANTSTVLITASQAEMAIIRKQSCKPFPDRRLI